MTKKRFILDDDGIVTDMFDLSMYMDNEDCCEKLNELAEDVEKQREFKFSAIRQANRIDKENEQLKEEYQKLKHRIAELELLNDGLNYALKNIRKIDVEVDIG